MLFISCLASVANVVRSKCSKYINLRVNLATHHYKEKLQPSFLPSVANKNNIATLLHLLHCYTLSRGEE